MIFISHKLSPAAKKDALAIKWAVLELRHYLLGKWAVTANENADGFSRMFSSLSGLVNTSGTSQSLILSVICSQVCKE